MTIFIALEDDVVIPFAISSMNGRMGRKNLMSTSEIIT